MADDSSRASGLFGPNVVSNGDGNLVNLVKGNNSLHCIVIATNASNTGVADLILHDI